MQFFEDRSDAARRVVFAGFAAVTIFGIESISYLCGEVLWNDSKVKQKDKSMRRILMLLCVTVLLGWLPAIGQPTDAINEGRLSYFIYLLFLSWMLEGLDQSTLWRKSQYTQMLFPRELKSIRTCTQAGKVSCSW